MRSVVRSWLESGIEAADPERLTREALESRTGPLTLIAIGKAAAAMCRGAAAAVGDVGGVCVTDRPDEVPPGVELFLGDHPVPGARSIAAGQAVMSVVANADIALISGGGSALCEAPIEGVGLEYVARVTAALLRGGADIEEMNLVRGHLSRIKAGGLGPIPTFVISDVGRWGPEVVSSGPTMSAPADPDRAIAVIRRLGIDVPEEVATAIRSEPRITAQRATTRVLADGRTVAAAVAAAAKRSDVEAHVADGWLGGPADVCLERMVAGAGSGVTVAAGEPSVEVIGTGRGGRNTHAALLAAEQIAGTDWAFAALATDGVDGSSGSAGAIVDGSTIAEGGDPRPALANSDSASYLDRTGSLLRLGPTGTNVADVWLLWKPQPILAT